MNEAKTPASTPFTQAMRSFFSTAPPRLGYEIVYLLGLNGDGAFPADWQSRLTRLREAAWVPAPEAAPADYQERIEDFLSRAQKAETAQSPADLFGMTRRAGEIAGVVSPDHEFPDLKQAVQLAHDELPKTWSRRLALELKYLGLQAENTLSADDIGYPKGWPYDYTLPTITLADGQTLESCWAINKDGKPVLLGPRETDERLGAGLATAVYKVHPVGDPNAPYVEKYLGNVSPDNASFGKFLRDISFGITRGAPFSPRHNPWAALAVHISNTLINDLHVIETGEPITPYILYTRYDEATNSYVQAYPYVEGRKVRPPEPDFHMFQDRFWYWLVRPVVNRCLRPFGKRIDFRKPLPFFRLYGEVKEATASMRKNLDFIAGKLGFTGIGRQTDRRNVNALANPTVNDPPGEYPLLDISPGVLGGFFPFFPQEIGYFDFGAALRLRNPFSFSDSIDWGRLRGYIAGLEAKGRITTEKGEYLRSRVDRLREIILQWQESERVHRADYKRWVREVLLPDMAASALRKLRAFIKNLPLYIWRGVVHAFKFIFIGSYRNKVIRSWIGKFLEDGQRYQLISQEQAAGIASQIDRDPRLFKLLSLYVYFGFMRFLPIGASLMIGLYVATHNPIFKYLIWADGLIRAAITLIVMRGSLHAALFSSIPMVGALWGPAAQIQKDYPQLAALILRRSFLWFGTAFPGIDIVSYRAYFYVKLANVPLSLGQLAIDCIGFAGFLLFGGRRKNAKSLQASPSRQPL